MSQDEVVLSYDPSDDSRVAAYSMAHNLKSIFRFYTEYGDNSPCWVYQEHKGIWVPRGKELIQEIVTRSMSQFFKSRILNEVINQIRNLTRDESVVLGKMAPSRIVMMNGVFDMDTGKFSSEFNPDDYQLMALPYKYDADADCPRFKQFLEEVCPNEDERSALVEFMGYCLIHHHRIHNFIVLIGKGENGKDRFCGALITMLGSENVSGMTLQQLAHDRFMAVGLRDKLANICPDIPPVPIKITSIIKSLTGESSIEVQKKHQNAFTYKNSTKLFFSANQIPDVNDMTDAWFRRVRVIEFPNQFLVSNPKRDENLGLKLDAEVQGIFNLAVEGWQRLKAQGKLTGAKSTEYNRIDYLKRSNPLQYFVYRFCEPDLESMITVDAVFQCYKHVSKHLGKFPITKNWFSTRLLELLENVESRHKKIEGKTTRIYAGLKVDLELLKKEVGYDIDNIYILQEGIFEYSILKLKHTLNAVTDPEQQKLDIPGEDAPDLQVQDVLDYLRDNPGGYSQYDLRDRLKTTNLNVDNWKQIFKLTRTHERVTKKGKTPILYSWTDAKQPVSKDKKFPRLKRDRAKAVLKLFGSKKQNLSISNIQKQMVDIYGSGHEDNIADVIIALLHGGEILETKLGIYKKVT